MRRKRKVSYKKQNTLTHIHTSKKKQKLDTKSVYIRPIAKRKREGSAGKLFFPLTTRGIAKSAVHKHNKGWAPSFKEKVKTALMLYFDVLGCLAAATPIGNTSKL